MAADGSPSRSVEILAEVLAGLGVHYAFVGGVAVTLSGHSRFTADVDVVALGLDSWLEDFHARLLAEGYEDRFPNALEFARSRRVLLLWDAEGVGIDIMLGLLPFDEEVVAEAKLLTLLTGIQIPVATPEHLCVMKAVAWRDKDRSDISSLAEVLLHLDKEKIVAEAREFFLLLEIPDRELELRTLLRCEDDPGRGS